MDGDHSVAPPGTRAPRWVLTFLGAGLVCLAGLLVWLIVGHGAASPATPRDLGPVPELARRDYPESPPTPPVLPPSLPQLMGSDGVPVMGPGTSDSTANGPRHPHPITPEHQRLFHINNLIFSAMGAADVHDYQAIRRFVRELHDSDPEDLGQLQKGYSLIADCFEKRTPDTTARARAFDATETASPARRYVRRYCLE
jgi:hypothetical protein